MTELNKNNKEIKLLPIASCTILLALSIILSMIKIIPMPQGGSVTLFGMLPLVLIGYFLGIKYGAIGGVLAGIFMIFFDGFIINPLQLLIDYPIAFGMLGVGGAFFRKTSKGLPIGYIIAVLLRYACSVLSGILFFRKYLPKGFNIVGWSLMYNITYIGIEAVITAIILFLPPIQSFFSSMQGKFLETKSVNN